MKLVTHDQNGLRIMTVQAERIDAAVAIRFKDQVREAAADAPERVILDLQNITFIDSSGLGAIVAAMKLLPKGVKMELASLNEGVDKVFRMTRMDKIFDIHCDTKTL